MSYQINSIDLKLISKRVRQGGGIENISICVIQRRPHNTSLSSLEEGELKRTILTISYDNNIFSS